MQKPTQRYKEIFFGTKSYNITSTKPYTCPLIFIDYFKILIETHILIDLEMKNVHSRKR